MVINTHMMNGYDLSRRFWDYAFNNPEKIKPVHTAVYFFAIEHCNRLGWKEKFGYPTTMVMEAIGVKSYNTYVNALNDLVEMGFIQMIERSKNQYSANIIALSNFDKALDKAHDKALDKAFIKHDTKQSESTVQSTVQSTVSINKPINKEQINIGIYNDVNGWFQDEQFKSTWAAYVQLLKDNNKPTQDGKLNQRFEGLMRSSSYDMKTAIRMINQSLSNDWVNLYELKEESKEYDSGNAMYRLMVEANKNLKK